MDTSRIPTGTGWRLACHNHWQTFFCFWKDVYGSPIRLLLRFASSRFTVSHICVGSLCRHPRIQGLAADDVNSAVTEIAKSEMSSCDGSCGGANSADMATITLQLGLITGASDTITSALNRLYSVLAIAPQPAEGIQADSSFHQHGACS